MVEGCARALGEVDGQLALERRDVLGEGGDDGEAVDPRCVDVLGREGGVEGLGEAEDLVHLRAVVGRLAVAREAVTEVADAVLDLLSDSGQLGRSVLHRCARTGEGYKRNFGKICL